LAAATVPSLTGATPFLVAATVPSLAAAAAIAPFSRSNTFFSSYSSAIASHLYQEQRYF